MTQADLLKLYQGQFKLIKTLNYCSLPKLFFSFVLLNYLLALIWALPITSRSFFTEKNQDLSQLSPADKSLDTNLERGILSLGNHQEKSRGHQEDLVIKNHQNYQKFSTNQLSREIYFQSDKEHEITFFTGIISRQNFPDIMWEHKIYGVTQQIHSTKNIELSMIYTNSLKDKTLSNSNNANLTSNLTLNTTFEPVVTILEKNRIQEYSDYFGEDFDETLLQTKNVRDILTDMANQTGKESAVVYINAYPEQLQIILYTRSGQPIIKTIAEANRQKLMEVVLELRLQITDPNNRYTDSYLSPAQKLYDWLIAPILAELKAANIETLLFSMDEGLRTLPIAALHDGEQFLIEKYSLSLIPSVSLMDANYRPLQDTQVLAMGASEFVEHKPLPAVPVELENIAQRLWQGDMFLNEDFTLDHLVIQTESYSYPIIHLATHADFLPGKASNSYIQLWGTEQIKLDKMRELGWNESTVELLVLSACRTALGDRNAELGFAGLAVAAGVKSVLASVWYVSDEGTLGLMTEFYSHLNDTKIKAEALRRAQFAMLRGKVVIAEGELRGSGVHRVVVLPSALANLENDNLSHPYYWAGFTMVGSPW
ncbi:MULTISPECIES: CHAT domain-containing protein [Okeania]|uniref:CHAT domain-containing protein n=1 Tax=Okeania hirsuta TaxID=1458930 RepID=A0A3N6PER4_9CYAN|nr:MULTISPECIES: CHAT domain-containing protein [Okeania]NET15211.1 CHAT domain-containing protein [Okeania sp. SIO1H6]NES78374.1 CHAT domain-containing protein [Okeania sp. SIO1H4]NET21031.1 CHAT domain-containing protein [Okeania sp. SIO1H5]NET77858.1 CHAT domain-containing protein [Okeania sp. SIO1F9]NET95062.1 CHAT domain-containing protein [Okeania sp. SIO1H2]